jgi:hypothetical protein
MLVYVLRSFFILPKSNLWLWAKKNNEQGLKVVLVGVNIVYFDRVLVRRFYTPKYVCTSMRRKPQTAKPPTHQQQQQQQRARIS